MVLQILLAYSLGIATGIALYLIKLWTYREKLEEFRKDMESMAKSLPTLSDKPPTKEDMKNNRTWFHRIGSQLVTIYHLEINDDNEPIWKEYIPKEK